jgi:hypothetical protein
MSSKAGWPVADASRREDRFRRFPPSCLRLAWAHWTAGLVTFDPICDRRSRRMIVIPPAPATNEGLK